MKNVKKTSSKSKPRVSAARRAKPTEATAVEASAETANSEDVDGLDNQGTVVEFDRGSQQVVDANSPVKNNTMSPQPPVAATPAVEREVLTLALSQSLFTKLVKTAQDEGISLESFASELVAEGLVLRAWEIAERKNTMRNLNGGTQSNFGRQNNNNGGNHNGNHRNDNRRPRHGNNSGGGRRHAQNNNWMEDKAAFLEYVRNQEKRRR